MPGADGLLKASWGRRLAASILPENTMLREAMVAFLVVVVLEGVVSLAEATPWWEAGAWANQDWFMRAFSGEMIRRETAQPLAFIDIDDAAFAAWGDPMVTPRSHMLRLIQYAAAGGAKAVVIDVDLTRPAKGDDALLAYLAGYGARGMDTAPLIFIREFEGQPKRNVARKARPSLADAASRDDTRIHFASVAFERDDDQVVRRWRLWEQTCRNDIVAAIPSAELLTLAIVDDPKNGPANLDAEMSKAIGGICDALNYRTPQRLHFVAHKPWISVRATWASVSSSRCDGP